VTILAPDEYAQQFTFDLSVYDLLSPRSQHSDDGGVGASSFGCREEMRHILLKHERTDSPDKTAAIIGSYIDAGIKQSRKAANPGLIVDAEYVCTLPNGFSFPVHPDEVDPDEPSVTDYKTKNGLAAIRRGFADESYRIQRHIQGLAAIQAGVVDESVIVRNVFIDRSGADPHAHVEQEPFSWDVIGQATEFVNDVLYAIKHNETTVCDRPRSFCERYCAFYTMCRGHEIEDDNTPITDPRLARMVAAYMEAETQEKQAKELREALRTDLSGLTGVTDNHRIVSTWVNAANRTPYWKVKVTEK
jgi:hypothetical protein